MMKPQLGQMIVGLVPASISSAPHRMHRAYIGEYNTLIRNKEIEATVRRVFGIPIKTGEINPNAVESRYFRNE